ncbi:MAG: biotin transporter BioY [Methanosarcinaceae archaeon]|nr:biotin transporter BioY [Methanosarcinaceae archaeon]
MVNNNYDISQNHVSPVRKMVYASLFAAMTAVGAFMVIPLGPIPFTLQVLFVFMAGSMLKARWGMISMIIYVLLGVIGLPVFSGGASGFGVLIGPTGGYLFGFIVAAGLIGYFFEHNPPSHIMVNIIYMLAGLIVIYVMGVVQLAFIARLDLTTAIALGAVPFLPADVIKAIVAAVISTRYDI